jgi:hypothetical protein
VFAFIKFGAELFFGVISRGYKHLRLTVTENLPFEADRSISHNAHSTALSFTGSHEF